MDTLITMLTGAGAFRFVLQPLMSIVRGCRDGKADWQAQRAPYDLQLKNPFDRRASVLSGLRSIWPVMLLAVVLDLYYQSVLFGQITLPVTALVMLMLAPLPYSVSRGLSHRWLNRPQIQRVA